MNKFDPAVNPALFATIVSQYRWYPAKHLLLLSDKLVKVAAGLITRLMVFLPPRHDKSELISKYFPAWYLGKKPDNRIILASYEADFAASWGRKARDLLEEYGPDFFNIWVRSDSSAANRWDLLGYDGGMVTASVGGPITGKGANIFIIDDPIKNPAEAYSKTHREKIWEWYRSVAYTRLESDDSAIILVMTRWHEDDLAGRLIREIKNGGELWDVVNLPAVARENDILGRQPGEALWPEKFTAAQLEDIQKAIGPIWWAALYEQSPRKEEGRLFKRQHFRYFEAGDGLYRLHRPDGIKNVKINDCWKFQTCDPAGSTKTTADYFVLATWAVTRDSDLLLLEIIRDRLEGPDQPKLFQEGYDRWHPRYQAVETKSMGLALYQTLVRQGLPVRELTADTDKYSRALPAAARIESGSVYFLKGAHWLPEYEDELVAFPTGSHDDQVDVTSYAVKSLLESVTSRAARPFLVGGGGY